MGEKPLWEQIGSGFVQHYYQIFDRDRSQLGSLYIDASCLSWEGQQFQGKTDIVEKIIVQTEVGRAEIYATEIARSLWAAFFKSLPFRKIQHSITAQDHQPTPDSCILSMVVGQLQADDDPVMGFHQIFLLKSINDAWVCTNDVFRLALHNFG